jgi:hypothetical protein
MKWISEQKILDLMEDCYFRGKEKQNYHYFLAWAKKEIYKLK